jgi:rhodanese-related sulfurtransferase
MFRQLLVLVITGCSLATSAQYKNDNVAFKTIDPSDLCATLEKNKGYILLDVRSKGEHYDTSQSPNYNLGHLKGAINIDIRELNQRLSEIRTYSDKPVFVYCSHSQRSRRAGKILADSGFNKVFNVNGGMTAIYYTSAGKDPCLQTLVETSNPYAIISAIELSTKMAKDNGPFILDVRSDSAWNHISLNPKENAYGYIKGATHISMNDVPSKLSTLPKDKEIIVTDIYGDEASRVAVYLKKNGFTNVSVLIEGVDRLLLSDGQIVPMKKNMYVSPVSYELINVTEFGRFAKDNKNFLILDIRSVDEFTNKHKDSWRNIGHLQNAVNMPSDQLSNRINEFPDYKNKDVVIYSFGSSPEVFAAANLLQQQGFQKIKVIIGGLFNLRWTAANTKGNAWLTSFVTDVPEVNR